MATSKRTCAVVVDEQGTECGRPAVDFVTAKLVGEDAKVDVCITHKKILNENAAHRRVSARTLR